MTETPTPPEDDDDEPQPTPGDGGEEKGLRAELAAAQREAADAKLSLAKTEALRKYPVLDENLLADITGSPEDVMNFADKLATNITARSSVVSSGAGAGTATTSPLPGPGDHAQPSDVVQARREDLREKVLLKQATPAEAQELAGIGLRAGLQTLAAQRR